MAGNVKQYAYVKGTDPAMDAEFASAKSYGRIRPGETVIFWKSGLRWCAIPVQQLQRIFRRVEPIYGKLCCGGRSYLIERLVLILNSGEELVLRIGDDMQKEAEALLAYLKERHPHIQYGKV